MLINVNNIQCRNIDQYKASNRATPFWIAKYIFNYESESFDKKVLDFIEAEGLRLAQAVNDNAANASTRRRSNERKQSNAIAGVLAEYCWKHFINANSLELLVKETSFEQAASQIDLETLKNNKTIEVRSSFPRNGIEFAICSPNYQFDILGPYKNNYKPNEIQKDFYLRVLFHVPTPISFLTMFKRDGFPVYLTGGASWDMMADDNVAIEKNLVPEDDINDTEIQSVYRVIPFSRALDCKDILTLIKESENS
ncbi:MULTISPECIES: hypothetical protein [Chryseobacterium]|uniref:hypothetical protein n=1 Tax=Chryseobacterium TaxID=59732 RepID=UPI000D11EDBF|nr:hypothetical protein [Chryseobacterium aurantiacum]